MDKAIVDKWLHSPNVPQADKDSIGRMSRAELEQAFSDAPLAFGTAGIRAKMGPGTQFLNRITYYQMATGYGRFLMQKHPGQAVKAIVAHDNRNNGADFSIDVANVLTSMGIKVYLFENNQLVSTPIVSFAIRRLGAHGAVIVTASHNPKEDNGFKIYDATGGQVLPDDGKSVVGLMPPVDEMIDHRPRKDDGLIEYLDEGLIVSYYEACKQALIKTDPTEPKGFPIVFSGQHGTACKRLPEFLARLGYTNVIPVREQCEFDGDFTNTPTPNPENREAWDLSLEYADRHGAEVIVQADPDADRFAMAVRHGGGWTFLSGNQMGIVYTYYVLKNKTFSKRPYVVSTYVSTNLIDRIAKDFGAEVHRVATGFKWVGAKMNEIGDAKQFVVGFEEAVGALNSTINRDKDAYQAAALALEIYWDCKKRGVSLIDLLEGEIYGKYGKIYNATVPFSFAEPDWKESVRKRFDRILGYGERTIGARPITKIAFNEAGGCCDWLLDGDSWLRFRMSGTEPKFKVYYNLYGDDLNALGSEAKAIDAEIRKLLDLR